MKASELNRILTATQAHPALHSSLSLRAANLPDPKKGQATT